MGNLLMFKFNKKIENIILSQIQICYKSSEMEEQHLSFALEQLYPGTWCFDFKLHYKASSKYSSNWAIRTLRQAVALKSMTQR